MHPRSTAAGSQTMTQRAACLVCSRPCLGDNLLCWRGCLLRANREIDANVAALHQRSADPEVRAALATRNGYLTSALLRWRP
jgi:hypothetical protein